MSDAEQIVEVKGLKKTFRDFWLRPSAEAVKGVDFEIRKGDVFGLLGPNGSGKSTTVKMMLGLLSPTAGTVKVFGLPPRSREVRARIGYLPELSYLHPFLTARETLMYHAGLSGMGRREARARSGLLLEQMGLAKAADRAVGGFSKGMARRVALAAALVAEPQLLVLDEPTSGLDPIGTREVKEMVRDLAAAGTTVVMTSHLLADAEDVCSRMAILADGKVAAYGSTSDLLVRSSDVRFTVKGMSADDAARLAEELSSRFGQKVETDHPRVPLEDFFMETVEKARG